MEEVADIISGMISVCKVRSTATSKEMKLLFFFSQYFLQSIGRQLASPLAGEVLNKLFSCPFGCVRDPFPWVHRGSHVLLL